MGGVVKAVTKPLAGAFNFVTKATGLGKASDWKDKSVTKDPNRLAYQWDVYDTHQKSRQARDLSEARGAFTGQISDYATLARDARALRNHITDIQPDVDLSFDFEERNGDFKKVSIPIGINFFWPAVEL